jgi:aminoglycoside phosphotransferase (APT) family kinase protein
MKPPGPLLAAGRDADIFEYGPGLVLRRSREGHSMVHEARTMAYLREQGYPVPAVEELSDDGTELAMERIEGRSMVDAITAAPWSVRRQARTLADLHHRLHDIAAPDFLPPGPVGTGDRVVHMDLHPLNVMVARTGPVVIDWTNAAAGDPLVDVGVAWVLMAAGQIPGNPLITRLLGWGRALLVNGFVSRFDRTEVTRRLRAVVEWKVQDPHMSEVEMAGMWDVVARAEAAAGSGDRKSAPPA